MSEATPPARPVRRRTVFYIGGFDPKGAAHYHALYRDEAAKQASVSGLAINVGKRQKSPRGNAFWQLEAPGPDGVVQSRYEVLRWDDIVRQHWPRNQARLVWDMLATTALNLRTGALWHMFKLSWPPVVALVAPVALLLAVLLGAPLLAWAVFAALQAFGALWAAAAATATLGGALWAGLKLQQKYSMLWMMRSYAFTAQQAQGQVPALNERLAEHARTLLEAASSGDNDEVLLVAHSSGSIMAATVLAKALEIDPMLGRRAGHATTVSLLTLGQWIPLLGCLPQADGFRADLQRLASAEAVDWVDFGAPPDGCCFALVDPIAACGVVPAVPHPDRPKLLSPRFADMFGASAYAALRRDRFRIHFQYLMASERAVPYDFFAITAGHVTLAQRFASLPSVTGFTGFQPFKGSKHPKN
ncbi:MAG: hypothetical protein ACKVOT_09405 [Polaromonas sp.]